MFIRTESFQAFLRLYPIISLLVGLHFLLWFYTSFFPGGDWLLNHGIGFNYKITEGEYWRLLTPIFFHAGFGHALFNSFSLVIFGPYLERLFGKFMFVNVYLGTGIVANIATFLVKPLQYLHLGASGSIFGLFGIYVYMVLNRKDLIDRANSQIVMVILIVGVLMTFTSSNVNVAGHLFGLIAGAALAPIVLRRI